MKRSGTKTTTVGEIVNLMSVDCQRIQDAFLFSFYIVLIFVIIIIATVQLWDLMGKFLTTCIIFFYDCVTSWSVITYFGTYQLRIRLCLLPLH